MRLIKHLLDELLVENSLPPHLCQTSIPSNPWISAVSCVSSALQSFAFQGFTYPEAVHSLTVPLVAPGLLDGYRHADENKYWCMAIVRILWYWWLSAHYQ